MTNSDLKKEILQISNNGLDFYKLVFGDELQLRDERQCKNVKNLFYDDNNPSFSIYVSKSGIWHFKDYGNTDYSGDVFNFAALFYKLNIKKDFRQILLKMKYDLENNQVSFADSSYSHSKKIPSTTIKDISLFDFDFTHNALNFWKSFGITVNILQSNNVKQISGVKLIHEDGSITVKNYQSEMLFAYKFGSGAKIYSPNPKKFWYVGNKPRDYIFGESFATESNSFFLVGGEKDVMTLHGLGYNAICFNSETAIPSSRILKDFLESNVSPIILYDCDDTGKINAQKLSQKYDWRIADLSSILTDGCSKSIKDISDYVKYDLPIETLKSFLNNFLKPESIDDKKDSENIKDSEDLEFISNEEENVNIYNAIPSQVYNNLPKFLISVVEKINQDHKRDLVLTGSLSVLSNLLNVTGVYDNTEVYPNLFLFITAPAAAGKSVLKWVRKLGDALKARYKMQYDEAVKNYREEGEKGEKPKKKTVFVSANSSIAALLKQLHVNDDKGIMLETEADALNGVMQNQWGNLSDVLRRCFEFEPLSSLRADDDKTFEIDKPRLSIVLTGTKNQLFDLIPNPQNGLFSRFLFFEFPLIKTWINPFQSKENFEPHYFNLSKTVMSFYDLTEQTPVRFSITESQEKRFHSMYVLMQDKFDMLLGEESIASIRRIANMQFRIAMILSTIRMLEQNNINEKLECSDIDFETSEILVKWFMKHTENIYQQLPNKPKSYTILKSIEAQFYDALSNNFSYQEALEVGYKKNIPKGTVERFIRKLIKIKLIIRVRHSEYAKCEQS